MRPYLLLFLVAPMWAASYTATQSGNFNVAATWGGAGVPGFSDTWTVASGYTVTCPGGVTCNSGNGTLGDSTHSAGLTVANGAVLDLRGTITLTGQNGYGESCSNGPSFTLSTGGLLELDENNGSAASGFSIASATAPCTHWNFGTAGDQIMWSVPSSSTNPAGVGSLTFVVPSGTTIPVGYFAVAYEMTSGAVYVAGPVTASSAGSVTINAISAAGSGSISSWVLIASPTAVVSTNNASANGVLLLNGGTGAGDSVTNWNGVIVTACGSASVTCFEADMEGNSNQTSWAWNQVYLNASSWFGSNWTNTGAPNQNTPITLNAVISSGRLNGTDIIFNGTCSSGAYSSGVLVTRACPGARSITDSLIRDMAPNQIQADQITAGMTITNSYIDGIGATNNVSSLTAANIAGGSWSYDVVAADTWTCSENGSLYPAILAPTADHIFSLCSGTGGVPFLLAVPTENTWNTTINLSKFIFDNETSNKGVGHCLEIYGTQTSGFAVNLSYMTVLYNAALGGAGCQFSTWSATCPASPVVSITHLLQPGNLGAYAGYYFCEAASATASPNSLSVYKGNIYYDSAPRNNPVGFGNSNAANQPANVVTPTGTDYNLNYNFEPFVTTPYTTACTVSTPCTNNGSAYAVPMTGSAPGAHDLNVAPGLLDNTRTAYSWAATRGQPATAGGFRQVFINGGPSLIGANIASLFWYIDQGNKPTQSLWGAMPDSTTIGPSQPVMFGAGAFGLRPVIE